MMLLLYLAGAMVCGAADYNETVRVVDYGFNTSQTMNLTGAELHSNAAPDEMEKRGLEYGVRIYENGTRERYAPRDYRITAYNYDFIPVSYHAGKGAIFGNGVEENLNLRLFGIGFIVGINESPSKDQIKSAAEFLTGVKHANPGLKIIGTQTVFSANRTNLTALCNDTACRVTNTGLIANSWYLSMMPLCEQLNLYGDKDGFKWQIVMGYNHLGDDYWPVEYIADINVTVPEGFAAIMIS